MREQCVGSLPIVRFFAAFAVRHFAWLGKLHIHYGGQFI